MTRTYKPRSLPPVHGTRAHYVHGKCRCSDCRAANRSYELERRAPKPCWHPDVGVWVRYTQEMP